jgi:hypothetical protein
VSSVQYDYIKGFFTLLEDLQLVSSLTGWVSRAHALVAYSSSPRRAFPSEDNT